MGYQRLSVSCFLVSLLLACAGAPPEPKPPEPGRDCKNACSRLRELRCDEGDPTPDGATCEEVCANGMADRYDLGCIEAVEQCVYIDGCER